VDVQEFDLIIMTQSFDLENRKAPLVACCRIHRSPNSNLLTQAFLISVSGNAFAKAVLKACTCSRTPKRAAVLAELLAIDTCMGGIYPQTLQSCFSSHLIGTGSGSICAHGTSTAVRRSG
jgi:hypothetical protein